MGKSYRTISRYVATLEKNGYLVLVKNYLDNGCQVANTLLVRFPLNAINAAKSTKDRLSRKTVRHEKSPSVEINPSSTTPPDKIDYPRGDKTDLHNTNKKHTIRKTNNSNDVVCFPTNKGKQKDDSVHNSVSISSINKNAQNSNQAITKAKELIEKLGIERQQAEHRWLSEKDMSKKLKHLEIFGQIESTYLIEYAKLNQLESKLKQIENEQMTEEKLNDDLSYINQINGSRAISPFSFQLLKKELQLLGYEDKVLTRLANEICYEIRFGSLRYCRSTGAETTIQHAIHIALKLVREKRWQTPIDMAQFLRNSASAAVSNVPRGT